MAFPRVLHHPVLYLICNLVLYAGLLLPTVQRQGISWDEQIDIWVRVLIWNSQIGVWLGSTIDPSQTRLPTFSVAVGYRLFHNTGLILGRFSYTTSGVMLGVGITGLVALTFLVVPPEYLANPAILKSLPDRVSVSALTCYPGISSRPQLQVLSICSRMGFRIRFSPILITSRLKLTLRFVRIGGLKTPQEKPSVPRTIPTGWSQITPRYFQSGEPLESKWQVSSKGSKSQ